jgi:hypothetical protein
MTQRERQASGGVSEAAPRPGAGHASLPRPTASADPSAGHAASWEDVYRAASPAQQAELLRLAQRQGVLYAHQLPPTGNGTAVDRTRQFVARLLNGQTSDLEPLRSEPIASIDDALDAVQREAVVRALATPDVCLIQGLPGTGKSRVVAEIVTQAALRGERVLLLASTAAAIDRVLEQVAGRDPVCPIRCLSREERGAPLPPAIAALTFAERLRSLRELSAESARQAIAGAEQRSQRLRQDEPIWSRLDELAGHHRQLDEQIETLHQRRSELAGAIEQEATAAEAPGAGAGEFASAVQAWARRRRYVLESIDHILEDLRTQVSQRQEELSELTKQVTTVRPLADATEHTRIWTGAWWRAKFQGITAAQVAELETRTQTARDGLTHLEEEIARVTQQRDEALATTQAERQALLDAEASRRQTDLDDQEAMFRREQGLLQNKWQVQLERLDAASPRPTGLTVAAVAEARAHWQRRLELEDRQQGFAREWAAGLDQLAATLPDRLAGYANLVAATTTSIAGAEHFGDGSARGTGFDLLVLEEAHLVTESEFISAARRARRWVLVGAAADTDHRLPGDAAPVSAPPSRAPAVPRPRAAPASLRPGFFQRLWQELHCDPRRWPYAWVQENDRVCCRLRPLLAEQRQHVESERVHDFPDIELRILALPGTEPELAEVIFPPSMSIEQAKHYIFRELEQLPVRAVGHSLRWTEEHGRLILQLAPAPAVNPVPIMLGAGVRELVGMATREANGDHPGGIPWHTCRLEFDLHDGWHRRRAEDWVHAHLGVRDLGRTVRLDVPHRMHPELASVVSDLLFPGSYCIPARSTEAATLCSNGGSACHYATTRFQFIAVPPADGDTQARRHADAEPRKVTSGRRVAVSPLPRAAKGGAGLELDLADLRHRDRLPSELRPALPERGLVNYLEAQAVVRALETQVADAALRADRSGNNGAPAIGVMALYPAQVELIRRLMEQSPALAAADLEVQVDSPAAFHERECQVVLLSLTRSHSHRAVSFGTEPQLLPLALTRARHRLLVFGDPGTLARRGQWEGPVDHLDEEAAARERELIAQLVRYLQGLGASARSSHVREGSSK